MSIYSLEVGLHVKDQTPSSMLCDEEGGDHLDQQSALQMELDDISLNSVGDQLWGLTMEKS